MKKLQTRTTFAGTRINIEDENCVVLCSIDYLSFGADKNKAKLFAGQLVNAWNRTYGENENMKILYDLEEDANELQRKINLNDSNFTYGLDKKLENIKKEINNIKKILSK